MQEYYHAIVVQVQNSKEVEFESLNLKQIHDMQWKLLCTCFHELTILFFRVFTSFSNRSEWVLFVCCYSFDNAIWLMKNCNLEFVKLSFVQLNRYETAPNFIRLRQNFASDCLLILAAFPCFYQFLRDVIIKLFCRSKQNNFFITSCKNW